ALQLAAQVDQLANIRVALVFLAKIGALLQRFVERDVQDLRDHVAQAIDAFERDVEHAADVADGRLGLQRTEGDDLGHALLAVFLADVIDHVFAPFLAEIDIDIGRLAAVRIEEALEEQVVFERIDVAELEHVADERAARRAAGAGRNALADRETDEIPDDEKVAGEAHAADDVQLMMEALERRLGLRRIALREARLA